MRRTRRERGVSTHHFVDAVAIDSDQIEQVASADEQRRPETVDLMQDCRPCNAPSQDVAQVVRVRTEVRIGSGLDVRQTPELVEFGKRDFDGEQFRPEPGDPNVDDDPARGQVTSRCRLERSHVLNVMRRHARRVTRR